MNKPDERDLVERFLVVRLTALGDILHTVPAVAAKYPHSATLTLN